MVRQDKEPWFVYTIYDSPRDYPGEFVVRRFQITTHGAVLERELVGRSKTLGGARIFIPSTHVRTQRHPKDDSVIVETWI